METLSVLLIALVLLVLSAICSGLNIALLSMDLGSLRSKARLGDPRAQKVLPLRENVHLTLSAILLTNVAVATTMPLVLNTSLSGLSAGIISTLALVVFGEILPQALFARHALSLYSIFYIPLKTMIVATYVLSKPLQIMLDKLVGKHGIQLHTRHELGVLVSEHLGADESELDEDEIEIIRGALQLSEKRVRDIMVPIKHVYWIAPDTVVNGGKVDEIKSAGRSRIPVLNRNRTKCYGVILMKDMVDINFDDTPIRADELPLYPSKNVGAMTALDTLFRKFISAQSHLLPVERDDKIVGIVTIEDLLEEIIGHEIRDESDRRSARA
jgi:metal transporter CNNM